jgi:hypothetical protein
MYSWDALGTVSIFLFWYCTNGRNMTDHHASHLYWSRQLGCVAVPQRMITLPPDDDPYAGMDPPPPINPFAMNLPQPPREEKDASFYVRLRSCVFLST